MGGRLRVSSLPACLPPSRQQIISKGGGVKQHVPPLRGLRPSASGRVNPSLFVTSSLVAASLAKPCRCHLPACRPAGCHAAFSRPTLRHEIFSAIQSSKTATLTLNLKSMPGSFAYLLALADWMRAFCQGVQYPHFRIMMGPL